MATKEVAQREIDAVDLLMSAYSEARAKSQTAEMRKLEASLQTHFANQGDVLSALSKVGDLEAETMISILKSQQRQFMELTLTEEHALLVENSDGDFDAGGSGMNQEAYEPVHSGPKSHGDSVKRRILGDFGWSLIPSLVLCLAFAMFWSVFFRE